MDAVILVGGFGTRLRPLTLTRPKQMLPIVDRPMIEHVVARLGGQGVARAVLSLGYRPEAFSAAYPDGVLHGVELSYAVEDEPMDTGGAIRFAATVAGIDDTFVAINGDVLTDLHLDELLTVHRARGAAGTIHLVEVDDPSRYGVVPLDADGRVVEFVEKPPVGTAPSRWINAGTYILEPSVLDAIPAGQPVSIERSTFPALAEEGNLYAVQSDAYWIDTGTPESYITSQLDLVSGRRGGNWSAIADDAQVDASAQVSDSVVMSGVQIGAGATATGSIICRGARVDEGAVVTGSVVGPGATVEAGASLTDLSMIGDGVIVAAGERLVGVRRPEAA